MTINGPSWLWVTWYAFGVGFGLSAGWGLAMVTITRGLPFILRALRENDEKNAQGIREKYGQQNDA